MMASPAQREYEARVQIAFRQSVRGMGLRPLTGPLALRIDAYWECPRRDRRARSPAPQRWRVGRPDADNVAKAVCDALNRFAWQDDDQVADLRVRTFVAAQGAPARVEVEIEELVDA